MIDIVFPGKSNPKGFVHMAEKLGYGGLCFVFSGKDAGDMKKIKELGENTDLKLYAGIFTRKNPKKKLADIYLVDSNNRKFIKNGFDIIFNIECESDSMHQRDSGLNQVLCRLMQENAVAYGISFSGILASEDRSGLIGRIMQNVRLCQKYKVNIVVASFAKKPLQMRNPIDLMSFARTVGIRNAKAALSRLK